MIIERKLWISRYQSLSDRSDHAQAKGIVIESIQPLYPSNLKTQNTQFREVRVRVAIKSTQID